jgi:metal-responsive CopG/Arc/MetJ family transcriptional regulator
MKKVVSVRLKEDILKKIDNLSKLMNLNSRTEFLKLALEYYLSNNVEKVKRNL